MSESLQNNFPGKKFYTQQGNHESYPVNVYDYFNFERE